MQALKKIMVANELSPIMDIPDDMQNIRVEVIVTPYWEYNENSCNFTSRVKSLLGSFKMPKNCSLDYKKEISEALEEQSFLHYSSAGENKRGDCICLKTF